MANKRGCTQLAPNGIEHLALGRQRREVTGAEPSGDLGLDDPRDAEVVVDSADPARDRRRTQSRHPFDNSSAEIKKSRTGPAGTMPFGLMFV